MNIVSFYAPRPEHPFFQDYRPFLALLRQSCERFGHRHYVLTDDPEVGPDAYVTALPRSLMKATRAAQLAYLNDPSVAGVPTLFVGADCVFAQDPAAFEAFDCDIAVTVGDFADCRINTGAIYVRDPALAREIWADALARCGDAWGDDQTSFEAALNDRPWHGAWTARVLELPVDPYNLAPEHPGDDCTRGVMLHFRGPRKSWMVDYCHKWLDLGTGITVRALPNMASADMLENVRINGRRDLPWVYEAPEHDKHAVLVGGGPSLADTLPEIQWRHAHGQHIFALNGAAAWLIERGIHPEFVAILDPRAENARFITDRGSVYLLASQCHPALFDALDGHEARVWHFILDGIADALPADRAPPPLIGGGLTVGLTAMGLAFAMGYRKLHLYGYDSSDRDDAGHAYAQDETAAESKRVRVWCGGQWFTSPAAMHAQAAAFPQWSETLADAGAVITVHGTGLLPTIARHMHAATLIQGEAA